MRRRDEKRRTKTEHDKRLKKKEKKEITEMIRNRKINENMQDFRRRKKK